MIHDVVAGIARCGAAGRLGVIDPETSGDRADLGLAAGQGHQARMEVGDELAHDLRRIARRIDGDEDRRHLVGGGAQLIERRRHGLQFDRTDIRTMGEAEEHQHELPVELGAIARLAALVNELEFGLDQRRIG